MDNLNLEYMLLSNAVRLAQLQNLHLKASTSCGLRDSEITHGYTIWWLIYVYDKYLALRADRPSVRDSTKNTDPKQQADLWLTFPGNRRPDDYMPDAR
jgi:hypothetical protein